MRLRRIEIRGWQCFHDELSVGPFGDGLNVVHAPNGRGKSTLFAALRRAIFDGHRTGGAEMNALRPWGRDLTPSVSIELVRDGVGYRIEKRYLDSPSARILRDEAGRFSSLAEGDAADEHARRLMHGIKPGRGVSDKQHWGLATVLWVPQGSLQLGDLSGPLSAKIRTSLCAQAGITEQPEPIPAAGGIEAEIEARYAAIFTETGKFRTGQNAAAVTTLEERLKELEAKRQRLVPLVEAFETASRRVEDLRAARAHALRNEQQAEQALKRLRDEVARFEKLEQTRREQALVEEKARQDHATLDRTITAIADGRGKLRDANAELARFAEAEPALVAAATNARARSDAAAEARAALQGKRREIEAAIALAEDAEQFVKASARLADLASRLARVAEADRASAELRAKLDALHAPTPKELAAIRSADAARREARAKLEASLITLTIEPTQDLNLRVRVGDQPGSHPAKAGEAAIVRGSPEVVVELPGVGAIRASGPSGSVQSLREMLEVAAAKFEKLTRPFGTDDVDELQSRIDRAAEVASELNRLQANRDALLAGSSADVLTTQRSSAQATVDRLLVANPAWRSTPPDPVALADTARLMRREHERLADEAQRTFDLATEARHAAERAVEGHRARMAEEQRRVAQLKASLQQLEAGFADDAARERRLADLQRDWQTAKQQLDAATAALAEFAEDPRRALDRAVKDLEALRIAANAKGEAEKKAEGQLEHLALEGAYSKLSEVLEQIAATTAELAREQTSAAAIKLLRDTLRAERRRAVEAVCGPVEQLATEYFHRIAGRRLGQVRLSESFVARGVMPTALNGAAEPVELERLSGGEQEQVHLAVRLALADVLCQSEGNQLVVLDDVLIATDSGRLGRVRTVLNECAQRLQIVVLTCHPERYVGMDGATYFDLEALVDGR